MITATYTSVSIGITVAVIFSNIVVRNLITTASVTIATAATVATAVTKATAIIVIATVEISVVVVTVANCGTIGCSVRVFYR